MGTDLHIAVLGNDEKVLEEAIEAAISELQRIEDLMTDWCPSPFTELNNAAGLLKLTKPSEKSCCKSLT